MYFYSQTSLYVIGNFGIEKKIIRIFRFSIRFLFDVLKEMKNIREIELTYEFQIIFFFFLEISTSWLLRHYCRLFNKQIHQTKGNEFFFCLSLEKFFPARESRRKRLLCPLFLRVFLYVNTLKTLF